MAVDPAASPPTFNRWVKRHVPSSPANYWELTEAIVANMQITLTPVDHRVEMLRDPHACMAGIVEKVIHEGDGDIHIWLTPDGTTKARFACEITPQQKIPPPKVGAHVRIYGLLRYDFAHGFHELHPVDFIEEIS